MGHLLLKSSFWDEELSLPTRPDCIDGLPPIRWADPIGFPEWHVGHGREDSDGPSLLCKTTKPSVAITKLSRCSILAPNQT
jgi:hypothetical protein